MSRKLGLSPQQIALAASIASSISFLPTEVSFQDNISYQLVVVAAGSSGQFWLQGSLDSPSALQLSTNDFSTCVFTDIMPCGLIAGSDDSVVVNVNQFPYKYIRLRYQSTTPGAGNVSIKLMARQVGG